MNMGKGQGSTSLHKLNGDNRNAHYLWPFWYVFNIWNNRNRSGSGNVPVRRFQVENFEQHWNTPEKTCSPSRKLTDLFYATIPWEKVGERCGSIRIADIGCGNGKYSKYFRDICSTRYPFHYTGVDQRVYPDWNLFDSNDANFKLASSSDAMSVIREDTNVIITTSALEHFQEDLSFFETVKGFVKNAEHPILQVHVVPSKVCLWLYGVHGVRQYTPETVNELFKLFSEEDEKVLYYLGGLNCNKLHFSQITLPLKLRLGDSRYKNTGKYEIQLKEAVAKDLKILRGTPSYIAFVINSNSSGNLF